MAPQKGLMSYKNLKKKSICDFDHICDKFYSNHVTIIVVMTYSEINSSNKYLIKLLNAVDISTYSLVWSFFV